MLNELCLVHVQDICTIAHGMQEPDVHSCNATPRAENGTCCPMTNSIRSRNRALLKALMARTGKTLSEIARDAGMKPSTLTRYYNNPSHKSELSLVTIDKLRQAYPEAFGAGYNYHPQPDDYAAIDPLVDYVSVEVLPTYAGAGGGGTGDGDVTTSLLPRSLVEDYLHAKPQDLLLIPVRGDSMEPDFKHGDQILIDKRDRNPIQPGPFAIYDGDGFVIKLVERVPGRRGWYRIFSANERYSSYEAPEDQVQIMGRPVWFARQL